MTVTVPGHNFRERRRVRSALIVLGLVVSVLTIAVSSTDTTSVDAAAGGQASRYVSMSPIRLLDTRDPGFSPLLSAGVLSVDPFTDDVVAAIGVDPLDVEAVAINLTITEPVGGGYLRTWPTTEPRPGAEEASAVNNQLPGETIANFSIVPVGANGRISVESSAGSQVIVDLQGVFVRSTSSRAGRFVPLPVPSRAVDTRDSNPVAAGTDLVVDLAASVGIPRTATAALINLTVTETQGGGYATAYPSGRLPVASNVNYPANSFGIAGSTIAQLDDGKVTIFTSATTDVIVDVVGYMTSDADPESSSGLFVPFKPERHYDSRSSNPPIGSTPLGSAQSRKLGVAGVQSVPADGVLAVASNITMTNTNGGGYMVAYPREPVPPNYSTVNSSFAGQSIANHAIVELDADGSMSFFASLRTDYVVDITGYFLDGTTPPPTTTRRTPTPDVTQRPVVRPTLDDDFEYLQLASGEERPFAAYSRRGFNYFGWNPCNPITYAVHSERATAMDLAALQQAIYDIEEASGFDFVYIGEATGSLDPNSVDPRVAGGESAMAVFAFSDADATPALAGGTVGIGGLGPGIDDRAAIELAPGDQFAWIVRDGFAIADIDDLRTPDEVRATFAHEIGHMLGLDHTTDRDELMFPALTRRSVFGNGDKYGLWSIGADPCASGRLSRSAPLVADDGALGQTIGFDVANWIAD